MVRNRKGRLPHIAVVTGEPTPGRIESIAPGSGDIDLSSGWGSLHLPLYSFSGEHLLCARLHPSNIDAAAGSVEELKRVVVRGDSGFCRDKIIHWCERYAVDYVLGLRRSDFVPSHHH